MATSNNRDVKMSLSVETLGTEDIKKLKDSIALLAKEGGDAAPEFQRLADEIGRLGDQSAALQAFQKLADETGELAARQGAASAAVDELGAKLAAAATVTQAATAAQRRANDALDEARVAQRATRDELATLMATTDAAGRSEVTYAAAVERLKLAKIAQRAEVERLSAALRESNSSVSAAEQEERKLEGTYNRAAQAAAAAGKAVGEQEAALRASAAAADALGVSTTDLATSQASVARGFTEIQQRTTTLTERLARLAEQERELAGIRAFQQQADDAKRLFDTASYADLFEQALGRVAAAEREVASAQAALDWQREAEAIVNAAEATQRLTRQKELMLQVQQELANDRSMQRQAEEAERLARQADQIRLFTQRLDELEQQERATAEAAEQAGAKIKNAFGAVGVRSVAELRAEIAEVRAGMETLRTTAGVTGGALNQAFAAGNAKIKELERDIREVSGQLTVADRVAGLFKNSLGQIAAGNIIADGVGYLVNKVKELGASFVEVTMQTERMRKGLQAVYGSAEVAAQQFTFLRTTANASGVSVTSISDAFLRFSAATKSANLPLSVTNDLFVAVTRAGATLGLTGEQVTGTLDALGQMASKGVVSMEELRQQLGDRLPGALSLAAKGLKITDTQLISLVESGSLATRDFFPAFAQGLKTMAGDTDTLTGAWQRFTNVLNEGAVAVGDAGGLTLLKLAVQGLTIAFGVIAVPIQGFIEVINLAARGIGVFYERMRPGGDGAKAQAEFQLQVDKSANRLLGLQNAIDGAVNGFTTSGTAAAQGAAGMAANAAAVGNNTSAVLANAVAVEQAARAQAGLSNAAGATGTSFIQQMVKLTENSKAVEGKALVSTAQLTGDASKMLDAASAAATANVAASAAVVQARELEVAATQAAIATTQREIALNGDIDGQRAKAMRDLTTKLTLQDADLEKSRQSTFELGRQALAAQASADAYADNTARLSAHRIAMESSRVVAALLTDQVTAQTAALGELKDQLETGKITQAYYDEQKRNLLATTESLSRATGDAAKFENLYRDAVQDSIGAVDRKARAEAANLGVTEALAKVQQSHYETMARQAKAMGDEAMATYYSIEAKQKQIETIKLATQIKNLELNADKTGIEIQIAALDPADKLYTQKKAELEIRLQLVKAKQIEAGASADVIKGIEAEIAALRGLTVEKNRGTTSTQQDTEAQTSNATARERTISVLERQNAAQEKLNAAVEKAAELERKRLGVDEAGFAADKNGQRIVSGSDLGTRTGIVAFLKSLGVEDDAKARSIANEFADARGEVSETTPSAGQLKYGGKGSTKSDALRRAAESVTFAENHAPPAAAPAPAPSAGSTSHTVTIQLPGGGGGTVNMASQVDANNLANMLASLGSAKKAY